MKKLFIVFALVFISSTSFAGILLEPYLGYNIGSTSQTGSSDSKDNGLGYGARLGWTLPLVFFAVDYSAASIKDKPDVGTSSDVKYSAIGAVVGASLPVLRLWAGYNFKSTFDVDGGGKLEGNGMKAGLGFKMPVLPISFNLEYILNQYDKLDGASITNDVKHKSIFVSVSAPLTF